MRQAKPHPPLVQVASAWSGTGQAWPQLPQLAGSVCGFVQAPPQLVCPDGQQIPPAQLCPTAQQVPLHTRSGGQQTPFRQLCPLGQQTPLHACAIAQQAPETQVCELRQQAAPQTFSAGQTQPHSALKTWPGLQAVRQVPPQNACPAGQVQVPPTLGQTRPLGQSAFVQQLSIGMQAPLHGFWPVGQPFPPQMPFWQR